MSRADMESASPRRHTLQAAGKLPEELSACCGVGGTRLAMMADQTRRKGEMVGREAVISLISKRSLARCSGWQGKASAGDEGTHRQRRGKAALQPALRHGGAGVWQHPAQQAIESVHAARSTQGGRAVAAVLPGAQHREAGRV
jgi:hypothetical protein